MKAAPAEPLHNPLRPAPPHPPPLPVRVHLIFHLGGKVLHTVASHIFFLTKNKQTNNKQKEEEEKKNPQLNFS